MPIRSLVLAGLVSMVVALGPVDVVASETIEVDCSSGDDLGAAIEAAPSAASILIRGTCHGPILVDREIILSAVDEGAMIHSVGAGATLAVVSTADERGSRTPLVEVRGLTISGGDPAVHVDEGASLSLSDVTVRDSRGFGAVVQLRGELSLSAVSLSMNAAGGIENRGGRLRLVRSDISQNGGHGIANHEQAQTRVTDSLLSDNDGRGVWNENSATELVDSRISGNGGGVYSDGRAYLDVSGSSIIDNAAVPSGSGVYLGAPRVAIDGDVTIRKTDIARNSAAEEGGGLFMESGPRPVVLVDVLIADNRAASGGGILNEGVPLVLERVTIVGNQPDDCIGCGA